MSVASETMNQSRGTFARLYANRKAFAWTLAAPSLVFLLLVGLYPTVYVLRLAFSRYTPGEPLVWVGFHNFVRAFASPRFWHGLYVTGWFAVISIGVQLLFGYVMALSLQAVSAQVRKIMTTIFLIPFMITPAVVAIVWKLSYHHYGPINYLFSLVGINAPLWLASEWALPALVVADVWQWTPFMTILLLAGLQSLSQEIYEAAYVDGATAWQAFRDHTLPMMKPFVFLAVFLRFIDSFKLFDLIFIASRGGPGDATESIAYFTYVMGFKYFDLGLAAALCVIQLIIIFIAGKLLLNQLASMEESAKAS